MIWECSRIRFDLIDDPIGWSQIILFFRSEIKRPSPEEIRKVREQELEEDLAIANVSHRKFEPGQLQLFYWSLSDQS